MYWAKIIGNPRPNYQKDGTEWSFDLALTDVAKKQLKDAGVSSYFKDVGDDRGTFIHLKRNGTKKDPADETKRVPAKAISVVDHHGNPWDGRLVGNGSTVNVIVAFNEYGDKVKKIQVSPLSIQVWDYVEYQPKSQFPVKKDSTPITDEYVGQTESNKTW